MWWVVGSAGVFRYTSTQLFGICNALSLERCNSPGQVQQPWALAAPTAFEGFQWLNCMVYHEQCRSPGQIICGGRAVQELMSPHMCRQPTCWSLMFLSWVVRSWPRVAPSHTTGRSPPLICASCMLRCTNAPTSSCVDPASAHHMRPNP